MAGPFAQLFRTGELEHVGEHAYSRLRGRAEAREGDGTSLFAGVCGLVAAAVWAGGGYALAAIVAAINAPPGGAVATGAAAGGPALNITRFSFVNIVFALGAGVVTYLVVREWRLAKTMRRLLNRAGCPYCEFSLAGLTPKMGAVKCPECGEMVVLAEHHIPPDALVLPSQVTVPDSGPLGSFKGEVPKGRNRRITRPFGGIPRRASEPPKTVRGSGEVL